MRNSQVKLVYFAETGATRVGLHGSDKIYFVMVPQNIIINLGIPSLAIKGLNSKYIKYKGTIKSLNFTYILLLNKQL